MERVKENRKFSSENLLEVQELRTQCPNHKTSTVKTAE